MRSEPERDGRGRGGIDDGAATPSGRLAALAISALCAACATPPGAAAERAAGERSKVAASQAAQPFRGASGPAAARVPAPELAAAPNPAAVAAPAPLDVANAMATVPAGRWRPFFPGKDEPATVEVAAFELDVVPVTVGDFLAFLRARPAWRRSRVPALFADGGYLRTWPGDLEPPAGVARDAPLTEVSWFAARAYCAAVGKRLPRLAEWERAAGASATLADARDDRAHQARILAWYGKPASERPRHVGTQPANLFGVRDLHGVVWEWVEDFATALVTGESRADSALERGLFCGAGAMGSADPRDYAAFMRFAMRSSLRARDTTRALGFRCAREISP